MLYINKTAAVILLILLGLETNYVLTCIIADRLNNTSETETVIQKINDGCGCSFYVKKVVEKKRITETNNSSAKNPSPKNIITNIKISDYITDSRKVNLHCDFILALINPASKTPLFRALNGVDHPPRS